VEERELLCGKKLNEGKRERRGRMGEAGAPGARGQGRAGLGRARPARLGRVAGQNPTACTTTDWNPIANRNPKRDEENTRLNMTSDKRNMLRHDATPLTT
jgi:hypothetical protein